MNSSAYGVTNNLLYGSITSSSLTFSSNSNIYYISASGSCSISGSSFIGGAGSWNNNIRSYIDNDVYIKIKLKDGTEVDIKLIDYIKFPYRMGKELEDCTKEEYEEWKMVNEL